MIDPPKPPDQIFIDDMPPMREEPPMIVEEPPVIDEPTITMDDINKIRRERGGPRIGDMMPPILDRPILDRNMIDYGYGPGIRPPLPNDFMIEDSRPKPDPIVPDIIPPKPPSIQERPLPIEDTMPIRLPEPMPMLSEPMPMPSPMPIRPRMPMPGPIATPMPMAPTNLQLPQIETQMPMMSLDRGIGSFKTLV